MNEWYQFDTVAIHGIVSQFKDWLHGYLETTLHQTIFLQDFYSEKQRFLGYVALKAFEIHIAVIHKTPEDIELIFLANKETEQVKTHIVDVLQAIHNRWQVAQLPYGFVNITKNQKVTKNLEERWVESQKTYQAEAWLSTIVLLGSILECVLLSKLAQNAKQAYTSKCVPLDQETKKKLKLTKWKLQTMIEVAKDLHWISTDFKNFSHALREYRNLIHPTKQIDMGDDGYITPTMCRNSRETIWGIIEELSKNISQQEEL